MLPIMTLSVKFNPDNLHSIISVFDIESLSDSKFLWWKCNLSKFAHLLNTKMSNVAWNPLLYISKMPIKVPYQNSWSFIDQKTQTLT